MVNSIAITLSIVSFFGVIYILFKRVPELVETESEDKKESPEEIEEKKLARKASLNSLLKKNLMKFKVLIQKAENKTSSAIKKLGEKSKEEKDDSDDDREDGEDYWKNLKK